jgi:proline iminopeptidase
VTDKDESALYPEIEPYEHGTLDVGDGNLIYWEQCGRPDGKPAVVFHGGPGAGCTPGSRRLFDPDAYRIVLFDQRGSGRSTPHAADFDTDLSTNTTWHLLADIERLRDHLDIERWLFFGGSWGATLAILYAEQHPDRVTELVLAAVTNTNRRELDWMYRGCVAPVFPEEWERFRQVVPEADRDGDLLESYYRLLDDPDPEVRRRAADEWSIRLTRPDRYQRARCDNV